MIIALAEIIKITINSFEMCTEYQTSYIYYYYYTLLYVPFITQSFDKEEKR